MNIKVYRGTHQIGGCVTEYEYHGWHLFVDYGEELPGGPQTGDLQVEGLTYGDISKSALLITHYHGDHIGCIPKLPKDLPIFMGESVVIFKWNFLTVFRWLMVFTGICLNV